MADSSPYNHDISGVVNGGSRGELTFVSVRRKPGPGRDR
jgi:hypothetical protein